MFHRACL